MVSTNSSPGNSSPKKSAPVLGTFLTAVLAVLALAATALPEMQATHKSEMFHSPIGYWHPTVLVPKN